MGRLLLVLAGQAPGLQCGEGAKIAADGAALHALPAHIPPSCLCFTPLIHHTHTFPLRVDTVPPLDLSADPSALLRATAASLGGSTAAAATPYATIAGSGGSAAQHRPGSAAFLLASLLNHSCEPNLDISWPRNNAVARFTAARDIAAHEQLTISYIDAGQGAAQRQAALQFAYGFACGCPRCREGT